jgi:STE24 endopeptidase
MNSTQIFTLTISATLLLNLLIKIWLTTRQNRCVFAHREQVPTDFADSISLEAHQKAADYTLAKSKLGFWDLMLDTVLLIGWTLLGGLSALNQTLSELIDPGLGQEMSVIVAFMLINGLFHLPLSLIQTFSLEEKFGFNKMTLSLWVSDLFKGLLVGAVLGLPILWLILKLMAIGGAYWWAITWVSLVVYQLFVMWIAPNLIMPLFNKFTPLEDDTLKSKVTDLMTRVGLSAKGFYVMDGSRRSAHSNAFFTGMGSNKRVVFFDTLLEQLSLDEMEAVLAHELGHFKLKHIPKLMITSFLMSLVGLAALGYLSSQAWFFTGLGVEPSLVNPNDALALILFMEVVPLVSFLFSPLSSARSRKFEFEADAFAKLHAKSECLKTALLKLYQDNSSTLTPDPIYVNFYHSHPPASQRLARLES